MILSLLRSLPRSYVQPEEIVLAGVTELPQVYRYFRMTQSARCYRIGGPLPVDSPTPPIIVWKTMAGARPVWLSILGSAN
jgi:hypothetical protein